YAFQQYDAAYAICRTVIEASVRDICLRRKLIRDLPSNVPVWELYQWRYLRDLVCEGKGSLKESLRSHYGDLSAAVHAWKSASKEDASGGSGYLNRISASLSGLPPGLGTALVSLS